MQNSGETLLQLAERHVLEGEDRIARQRAIIATMERDHHPEVAERARSILATMEESLRLARQHFEAERLKPAGGWSNPSIEEEKVAVAA